VTGDCSSTTIVPFASLSTLMVCNNCLQPHEDYIQCYAVRLPVEYIILINVTLHERRVHTSSTMTRPFPAYFNLTRNSPLSWPANGPLNMICTCTDGDMVDMDTMLVPPESRASPVRSELNASVSSALNLH